MYKIDTVDVQKRRRHFSNEKFEKHYTMPLSISFKKCDAKLYLSDSRSHTDSLIERSGLDKAHYRTGLSTLRFLRYPAIVVDDLMMIRFRNRAAEAFVNAGSVLKDRNGMLSAVTLQETIDLRSMLSKVIRKQTSIENPECFAFENIECNRHCLCFAGCIEESATFSNQLSASVLLLIADSNQQLSIPFKTLNSLFGLTQQEARIAIALLNGCSVQEFAISVHVSLNTARTHLKAVFQKTYTCSQSALVALLSRLVPPVTFDDEDIE